LGQDLHLGNLSAAQTDFATLQQLGPQADSTSSAQSNPIAQDFNQLSPDLEGGNVSAVLQDYTKIQQDFRKQASQADGHHHHHNGGESGGNAISQAFDQLGQGLQSGNQSAAQQARGALQQDFQQFAQGNGLLAASGAAPSRLNGVSVNA
jgi:hypothetical protein